MKKPLPWFKDDQVLTAKLLNALVRRLNEHEVKLAKLKKENLA